RVTVANGQVFPPLNSYFMMSFCFSIALAKSNIMLKAFSRLYYNKKSFSPTKGISVKKRKSDWILHDESI
ncbi:hypothetical protein, partial [Lactobacillus delbrueckii]